MTKSLYFSHISWETRLLVDNSPLIIVVENPLKLYGYLTELSYAIYENANTEFYFYSAEKRFRPEGCADIVSDISYFSLNNKRFSTLLTKKLIKASQSGEALMIKGEISVKLNELMNLIIGDIDVPVEFEEEPELSAIFKLINPKISEKNLRAADKLAAYVSASAELKPDLKAVFFYFLKEYLSENEISILYEHCAYAGITPIIFERRVPEKNLKIKEKIFIIDEDLCEILE
jgi:CRISPR type II-A/NMEMI-associated protein Csn2